MLKITKIQQAQELISKEIVDNLELVCTANKPYDFLCQSQNYLNLCIKSLEKASKTSTEPQKQGKNKKLRELGMDDIN